MRRCLAFIIAALSIFVCACGVSSQCQASLFSGLVQTEWLFKHHSVSGRLGISAGHGEFSAELGAFARGYLHSPDDLVHQVDTFSLKKAFGPLWVKAGSFRPEWRVGPSESIMATRHAPGSATLEYGINGEKVSYTKFASRLDSDTTFYAHRLTLSVSPAIRLGIKETALIRETPGIGIALVPGYPLYLTKYIPGIPMTAQDNINVGLDLSVTIGSSCSLYGEIHIAEWPLTPSATSPRVYGLQVGFDAPCILSRLGISGKYVRLGNYLYSGSSPEIDYQYRGTCLGHQLGQDADELSLAISYALTPQMLVSASASYVRKGEGKIGEYSGDFPPEERERNSFLRGTVEHRIGAGLSAELDYTENVAVEGGARLVSLSNAGHVLGRSAHEVEGYLTLQYSF